MSDEEIQQLINRSGGHLSAAECMDIQLQEQIDHTTHNGANYTMWSGYGRRFDFMCDAARKEQTW